MQVQLEEKRIAVSIDEVIDISPEQLRQEVFQQLDSFYRLPNTLSESIETAKDHRTIAKQIGRMMDIQFLQYLERIGFNRDFHTVVDILPLRGALALVSPIENIMTKLNNGKRSYSMLPIGVKRNGPDAKIYFPDEYTLSAQLAEITSDTVIRIKDFGIATGGTAVELMEEITSSTSGRIKPEQIVVQGSVGTLTAWERIRSAFSDVKVMFAVEGEMPIEREVKKILSEVVNGGDFLTTLAAIDKHYREFGLMRHNSYFLTRIRHSEGTNFNNRTPFTNEEVNAKDWGDASFTDMKHRRFIEDFMGYLELILAQNGQINDEIMQPENRERLRDHYRRTLAKN